MDLWLDFVYLLSGGDDFWAGFFSGISLLTLGWVIWWLFFRLHIQWLKVRQFFEPTKKPGKVPAETGPSPANMLLGCIGRVFITLLAIALAILLLWGIVVR